MTFRKIMKRISSVIYTVMIAIKMIVIKIIQINNYRILKNNKPMKVLMASVAMKRRKRKRMSIKYENYWDRH